MNNQAAWLTAVGARPLKIEKGPDPKAGPGEVVIKTHAVAINPVDWMVQDYGVIVQKYPTILGTDVAGEVVEVGEGVTNVQKGQRVLGHCVSLLTGDPKHSAFQFYATTSHITVSPIPSSMNFEQAAVLPLGISTAAECLFNPAYLSLPHPSTTAQPSGKTVLVYGGSSSVGSCAIQLAVAAGATVITTASSHNLDYVKDLGATHAFDYKSSSVVDDIVSALKGTDFYGVADCIATTETAAIWSKVLEKLGGGGRYASVLPDAPGIPADAKGGSVMAPLIIKDDKAVGEAVWHKFLPEALEKGVVRPKPDPKVIEGGLEAIQEAVDVLRKGVSASKIVVKF